MIKSADHLLHDYERLITRSGHRDELTLTSEAASDPQEASFGKAALEVLLKLLLDIPGKTCVDCGTVFVSSLEIATAVSHR
jgi:hypothetical protein